MNIFLRRLLGYTIIRPLLISVIFQPTLQIRKKNPIKSYQAQIHGVTFLKTVPYLICSTTSDDGKYKTRSLSFARIEKIYMGSTHDKAGS